MRRKNVRPTRKQAVGELSTREKILEVATKEFADRGLAGARVDTISARAGIAKRMIYYHFASKVKLYREALKVAYAKTRRGEESIGLEERDPRGAMRLLMEHTFDNHDAHPDFVRLVGVEDTHRAIHLKEIPDIAQVNAPIIESLDRILKRGQREGAFRGDVNALDVHLVMSSLSYFRVANAHTFGTIFECDLGESSIRERHKRLFVDMVMNYLTSTGTPLGASVSDAQSRAARRRRILSSEPVASSRIAATSRTRQSSKGRPTS